MEEKIPFLIENPNGHDTVEVPQDKIEEEAVKQLEADKMVVIEKENGETEILTKSDLPQEETKDETNEETPVVADGGTAQTDFSKKFEAVKSATVTNKIKGG